MYHDYVKTIDGDEFTIQAKTYDEPSICGIPGYSRISKLCVLDRQGKILYNYDRGFDVDHLGDVKMCVILDSIYSRLTRRDNAENRLVSLCVREITNQMQFLATVADHR